MKLHILAVFLLIGAIANAQYTPVTPLNNKREEPEQNETEERKGFDPNKVFVGGSIGLGLGFGSYNSSWSVGGFPQIGYSLTDWLDAGVIFNANFNSQKYDLGNGYASQKYTSFNYGTGVFARAFPFRSFFVQAQPEYNWTTFKIKSEGQLINKETVHAPSLLVGVGFGQRMVGQSGFFTTLMIDVMSDRNSPYRDYNSGGIIPILRGGFYVYLGGNRHRGE